jgi:hypothetical protein
VHTLKSRRCGGCRECLECGAIALERNRYFTGKYMTPRDFACDPDYLLSHHRLHNRLLHGFGIVCGLAVVPHPSPDCPDWVVVRSGIALDCCGRELVLPKDTAYRLPLPRENGDGDDDELDEPFVLCLVYHEERVEPVPALYAEGSCDPKRHEANRVREVACLEARRLDELEDDCWLSPEGGMDAPCRDDCDEDIPGPSHGCIEPSCRCGTCVPLALVVSTPDDPDRRFALDLGGRRTLPLPPDYLTHIVGISWPHGGEVTLEDLRDADGRLEVRFDRRLLESEGDGTGVNEFTFVVQYGGLERNLEFVRSTEDSAPGVSPDDPCVAVFEIDRSFYEHPRRASLIGNEVYVTLKCDFILDCHGNPVSGRHLRGRLPTVGDMPGGTFESWFSVIEDREDEEEEA